MFLFSGMLLYCLVSGPYGLSPTAAKVTGLVEKWVAAVRLAQALEQLNRWRFFPLGMVPPLMTGKSILIMGIFNPPAIEVDDHPPTVDGLEIP